MNLRELATTNFSLNFILSMPSLREPASDGALDVMCIDGLILRIGKRKIIELAVENGKVTKIFSDFTDKLPSIKTNALGSLSRLNGSIFRLLPRVSEGASRFKMYGIAYNICSDALGEIETSFSGENISHIGPLRAHPKRFYFLDPTLSTNDTDNIIERLRDNTDLKQNVNR